MPDLLPSLKAHVLCLVSIEVLITFATSSLCYCTVMQADVQIPASFLLPMHNGWIEPHDNLKT